MFHKNRALFIGSLLALSLASMTNSTAAANRAGQDEPKPANKLMKEVRHKLVMLPYYSVFDNLAYKVEGDKVILMGQVARPTLKSDAGNVVKSIEGVRSVENQIEVLPTSPMDDQLRRALYRTIYGESGLFRYGVASVPSVHIIVKNGHVTLEGVVDNEADKNMAGLRANGVPNVFSVQNNLAVAKS
ncbi:MAG TPA: BON domain-containing protein [Candidatus Sulfotelmatobacter sp.]|nr:BON domain-containing protein [Candidatus Sulfotelmatobacter sp.]